MTADLPSDEVSDWFWEIIDRAQRDPGRLKKILEELSETDIRRFHDEFKEAAVELHDPQYTERMGDEDVPDVSEDTMQDVSECVVSQGRGYYVDVLKNPEKTPNYVECAAMPTFSGVATRVFLDRFGKTIHHDD